MKGLAASVGVGSLIGCGPTVNSTKGSFDGIVLVERYDSGDNLARSPGYDGAIAHSKETLKISESRYSLLVDFGNIGKASISVVDNNYDINNERPDGSKEALELLIEKGSKIRVDTYLDLRSGKIGKDTTLVRTASSIKVL